ncbi:MAG: tetratricopeptide repeat protein [Flavobacteriaceae bacterium]|nr:tetratricopeptide repeat protein [Flavobacteriaceae bacterium]
MATYKRRGGKPRTKAEKIEKIEEESTTAEVFSSLDEGASRTEAWVEKNQKAILIIVGVIAISVLGYLGFQNFIQEPKEQEAMNEMFQAQSYYEQALTATSKDSLFNLSLNGGAGKYGFLDIIDNYGGTNAANLANYYTGIAYLNTGKYQDAIKYLDVFKASDKNVAPIAKGAIGDAFAQLDQQDEALKYYEKAASMSKSELTAPRFLLKAGITALNLGKIDVALKHFKNLTTNYPKSQEAAKATLYEGKAEAMQ